MIENSFRKCYHAGPKFWCLSSVIWQCRQATTGLLSIDQKKLSVACMCNMEKLTPQTILPIYEISWYSDFEGS